MSTLDSYSPEEFAADLAVLEADPRVSQLLHAGTSDASVRAYKKQVEEELHAVEVESVRDYVRQSSQVAGLHDEMLRCDAILAKMQEMLLGFQADLGGVSDEIKGLQTESVAMEIKLRNRRAAERRLAAFLQRTALPPDTASVICDGPVDDTFIARVVALDARGEFAKAPFPAAGSAGDDSDDDVALLRRVGVAPVQAASVSTSGAVHQRLVAKACSRSREYLLAKIAELRRLRTNVQLVQRTQLGRRRQLTGFLRRHAPQAYDDVVAAYADAMARALHRLFAIYQASLAKLELELANKHDLVAVHESSLRSAMTSKVNLTKKGDGFSLGDRGAVLVDGCVSPPILVHVAEAEQREYPYECLFRSVLKHAVDAAESEHDFVTLFFGVSGNALDAMLEQLFSKTLGAVLEHLENKLFACHDVILVLLVLRLVRDARLHVSRPRREGGEPRRLRPFAAFFDSCERLLLPRLGALFHANLESIRLADVKMLGTVGVSPHYVSRRYAELVSAARALFPQPADAAPSPSPRSAGKGGAVAQSPEALLDANCAALRQGVVGLLGKLTNNQKPKLRVVFQINNYDRILSILRDRAASAEADEAAHFDALLRRAREVFVEDARKRRSARGNAPDPTRGLPVRAPKTHAAAAPPTATT
mmetsp:Transcript_14255/g.49605  ORF Transcript_14255/g.49605 Transcript_14255/m.49605 type:complete len:649 (-) Transcript_14255:482-2428(-)